MQRCGVRNHRMWLKKRKWLRVKGCQWQRGGPEAAARRIAAENETMRFLWRRVVAALVGRVPRRRLDSGHQGGDCPSRGMKTEG